MRTYMIIPTYWTGANGEWEEGDSVYDHATPLNTDGTLGRTLKSISVLEDKDFTLIILGVVTNKKYLDAVEDKLKKIIRAHEYFYTGYRTYFDEKVITIFSCRYYPIESPKALVIKDNEIKIINLNHSTGI